MARIERMQKFRGPSVELLALAILASAISTRAATAPTNKLARLTPVAPAPAVVAAAEAQHICLQGFEPCDAPTNTIEAGDSLAALVTLCEKGNKRTQWLVGMRALPASPKSARNPGKPFTLYSSLGNKHEFKPSPVALEARTLGPYPVTSGGKAPKCEDHKARCAVDQASLALGLDMAVDALIKMQDASARGFLELGGEPFSETKIQTTRQMADQVHLTTEGERAIAGSVPALLSYFGLAQQTPG